MISPPKYHRDQTNLVRYGAENTPQPDWYVVDFVHDALLLSEPHYRLPNGAWNGGGPLFVEKISLRHEGVHKIPNYRIFGQERGPYAFTGVGDLIPRRLPLVNGSGTTSVGTAKTSLETLQGTYYTRGVLRTRPGRPEAGLGQFTAELADTPRIVGADLWNLGSKLWTGRSTGVIPSIRSTVRGFFGASASELLNVEFGWIPFLKDLRDFRSLSFQLHKRLRELAENSGKVIRKGANLGEETTLSQPVKQQVAAPLWNVGGGSIINGTGQTLLTRTLITKEERWFVGRYTYYINDASSWLWKGKAAAALLGVLPTPELIYDITPWTWLVDWWANVGETAAFFSPTAVDALTTLSAHTMRHRVVRDLWEATSSWDKADTAGFKHDGMPQRTFRSELRTETKERGAGWAPFGSVVPAPPLSTRQTAILAALGISRAAR